MPITYLDNEINSFNIIDIRAYFKNYNDKLLLSISNAKQKILHLKQSITSNDNSEEIESLNLKIKNYNKTIDKHNHDLYNWNYNNYFSNVKNFLDFNIISAIQVDLFKCKNMINNNNSKLNLVKIENYYKHNFSFEYLCPNNSLTLFFGLLHLVENKNEQLGVIKNIDSEYKNHYHNFQKIIFPELANLHTSISGSIGIFDKSESNYIISRYMEASLHALLNHDKLQKWLYTLTILEKEKYNVSIEFIYAKKQFNHKDTLQNTCVNFINKNNILEKVRKDDKFELNRQGFLSISCDRVTYDYERTKVNFNKIYSVVAIHTISLSEHIIDLSEHIIEDNLRASCAIENLEYKIKAQLDKLESENIGWCVISANIIINEIKNK